MARRPGSVLLAAAALAFAIAMQLGLIVYFAHFVGAGLRVGWGQYLFAVAVFSLLLWGIVGGYRLGWLWGRYLTFFLGSVVLVATLLRWRTGAVPTPALGIVLGGLVAPMLTVAWALGRPDSLVFYGLVCPICRTEARRGADFLFRRARCAKCGHVW